MKYYIFLYLLLILINVLFIKVKSFKNEYSYDFLNILYFKENNCHEIQVSSKICNHNNRNTIENKNQNRYLLKNNDLNIIYIKINDVNNILFKIEKIRTKSLNWTARVYRNKNNSLYYNITFLNIKSLNSFKEKTKYIYIDIYKELNNWYFSLTNIYNYSKTNLNIYIDFDKVYIEYNENFQIIYNNKTIRTIFERNKFQKGNNHLINFIEDDKKEQYPTICKIAKILCYIAFGTIPIVLFFSRCYTTYIHEEFWYKIGVIYFCRKRKIYEYNII